MKYSIGWAQISVGDQKDDLSFGYNIYKTLNLVALNPVIHRRNKLQLL